MLLAFGDHVLDSEQREHGFDRGEIGVKRTPKLACWAQSFRGL